jgi:hypothetical protein
LFPYDLVGSTRAIGPSRHRRGKPGAGAWRRQRMLAVVSPTSARSPIIAPGSPDHSSSRIASGCSMRGTNGDHRQPVQRQRAGASPDRQPLQHLWRQIGQPQESANEGLGDAHGDRGAPDRCDIPAIQPPPPVSGARITRSRCGSGGVPSAALSISAGCRWGVQMTQRCGACSCCRGSGNEYSPVYKAAARHRTFRGNEHATMTHPFSKGRSITRAHLRARTPNVLLRDNGAKYARQCPS